MTTVGDLHVAGKLLKAVAIRVYRCPVLPAKLFRKKTPHLKSLCGFEFLAGGHIYQNSFSSPIDAECLSLFINMRNHVARAFLIPIECPDRICPENKA